MATYRFRVIETRVVSMDYLVEAATEEEGRDLATDGNTDKEYENDTVAVVDRAVGELLAIDPQDDGNEIPWAEWMAR